MKTTKIRPWEKRPFQKYFPLSVIKHFVTKEETEIMADSGTLHIASIRGYLGESEALATEIKTRCNTYQALRAVANAARHPNLANGFNSSNAELRDALEQLQKVDQENSED